MNPALPDFQTSVVCFKIRAHAWVAHRPMTGEINRKKTRKNGNGQSAWLVKSKMVGNFSLVLYTISLTARAG